MKQFDILLANSDNELVWVCEIYADDVNDAITDAIESMEAPHSYVGHNGLEYTDGEWRKIVSEGVAA